ncbi:hypothetical protein [Ilumatobacter sp.]|uniref:hypothetical protein n=1 Tax=Ilumatobacter sp. TaxID=1967498 RepID=UPI003B51B030
MSDDVQDPVSDRVATEPPWSVDPTRWGRRLLGAPVRRGTALLVVVVVVRSGIGVYDLTMVEITQRFPMPHPSYKGVSVIGPALASWLGVDANSTWVLLHAPIVVAVLSLCVVLVGRGAPDRRTAITVRAVVLASGLPVVLLGRIGHYDVWFALGSVLVVLAPTLPAAFVGGAVLGATNISQAGVALVACALCAGATGARFGVRLATAAVGALAARALVGVWYRSNGVEVDSRVAHLTGQLTRSMEGFARSAPLAVWSWFGAAWVVVIALVLMPRSATHRAAVGVGLIGLPALASVTTLDGTRVFVMVSLPALLVLLARVSTDGVATPEHATIERATWTAVGVMLVTPGLMTWVDGEILSPWGSLLGHLTRVL